MFRSGPRIARQLMLMSLTMLVAVPAAGASTVSRTGDTIVIVGGSESSNISFPAEDFVVDEAGVTAGAGCQQISSTRVDCHQSGGAYFKAVQADLGEGDDRYVQSGFFPQTVNGGGGDDNILAGAAEDTVHGDAGNDTIDAGDGRDVAYGDAGDDQVGGGDGNDTIDGGAGKDLVSGDYGDLNDDGSDTIAVRDGEADRVSCGLGADVVTADDIDVTDELCEQVDAQPVSTGGGGATEPPGLAISLPRSIRIAKVTRSPGLGVGVVAAQDGRLVVKLTISALTARRFGLGKKAIVVDSVNQQVAADSYAVGMWASGPLRAKLKALARRAGFTKLPAKVTASLTNADGLKRTRTAAVSFKR